MYVFGVRRYGVVDQVPSVLHVATRFFHFNYFPLLPLGSVLVVEAKVSGTEVERPAPFSFKSLLFGWGRSALVVACFLLFVAGFDRNGAAARRGPAAPRDRQAACWIAAGACGMLWWGSHWLTRAGQRRAAELADLAGVPRDVALARFGPVADDFTAEPSPSPAPERAVAAEDLTGWRSPMQRDHGRDDVYRLE